jgi:site-specific recombinase XerD
VVRGLSKSRQSNLLLVLRLFLKFCRNVLKPKVLEPGEIQLPRLEVPHVSFLTNDEVSRMLEQIPVSTFTGLRLWVLVEVLLASGLRISEALALDRRPFDQGVRELEIVGKGKHQRTVFFNKRALLWIRKMLALRGIPVPRCRHLH